MDLRKISIYFFKVLRVIQRRDNGMLSSQVLSGKPGFTNAGDIEQTQVQFLVRKVTWRK